MEAYLSSLNKKRGQVTLKIKDHVTVKIMNLTETQELHRKKGKCIPLDFLRSGSGRTQDLRQAHRLTSHAFRIINLLFSTFAICSISMSL